MANWTITKDPGWVECLVGAIIILAIIGGIANHHEAKQQEEIKSQLKAPALGMPDLDYNN